MKIYTAGSTSVPERASILYYAPYLGYAIFITLSYRLWRVSRQFERVLFPRPRYPL